MHNSVTALHVVIDWKEMCSDEGHPVLLVSVVDKRLKIETSKDVGEKRNHMSNVHWL